MERVKEQFDLGIHHFHQVMQVADKWRLKLPKDA